MSDAYVLLHEYVDTPKMLVVLMHLFEEFLHSCTDRKEKQMVAAVHWPLLCKVQLDTNVLLETEA